MRFKLSLLMGLFLLSGCVTKRENQPFSSACLEEKKTVVIAQISERGPSLYYINEYGQETLDFDIISDVLGIEFNDIKKKIKLIDPKPLIKSDYYKRFSQYFSKKNMNVVQYFKLIDGTLFARKFWNEASHPPRDLTFLKEKFKADYKADYALILDQTSFGAIHGGPYSDHSTYGYSLLLIYMIDLETNHIEGYFESKVFVPVPIIERGFWDSYLDANEVIEASKSALRRSLLNSYNYLISSDIDEALDEDLTGEDSF